MKKRITNKFHPMLLTDTDIAIAVKALPNKFGLNHESPDSVRISVEWLSAQRRTSTMPVEMHNLKHLIENWGGRYVSRGDVQVAALLLDIKGIYPSLYLDMGNLVLPDKRRLAHISEAHSQKRYRNRADDLEFVYKIMEVIR